VIAVTATAHVARQHTGERPPQGAGSCNVVAISLESATAPSHSGRGIRRCEHPGAKVAVLPSVGCTRGARLRVQRCHHAGAGCLFGTCALAADWRTKSWIVGRPAPQAGGGARPPLAAPVTGARMERTKSPSLQVRSRMTAWAMRAVDGIRILMFSSPWPSRKPVGNGFPNADATGLPDGRTGGTSACIEAQTARGPRQCRYTGSVWHWSCLVALVVLA
jgi:hypothetical protein